MDAEARLVVATLAADIGARKITVGRVAAGEASGVLERPTPAGGPEAVLARVVESLREVAQGSLPEGRIGVACAGLVHGGKVTALNKETMPGWEEFPLAERLAGVLGREVVLLNDANAAAWAEARLGAGRGARDMVYLTVGAGIGAGLITHGRLLVGRGHAGEVGHAFVDPNGPVCGCGRRGCLEAIASGNALARVARRELGLELEPEAIVERAAGGEPGPRALVARSAENVARAMRDLVAIIDPERFVIGGRIGLAPVWREALRHALEGEAVSTPVVPSELGTAAGIIGAAEWAVGESA
jgi:predicted NBD/HSP70 family sugar kinase